MRRFGELGFLGLRYPPEYGGQGGDYFSAVVLSEEMARAHCGGLGMAVAGEAQTAAAPGARFGKGEEKRGFLAPPITRRSNAPTALTATDARSPIAWMRGEATA